MDLDIISLIKEVGFPVAVTFWFMFRTEKVIDRNTQAFENIGSGCPAINKKKE